MKKTVVLFLTTVILLLGSCNTPESTSITSDAFEKTSENIIVINELEEIPSHSTMNIALMVADYVFVDFNEYYGTDITPTLPEDICGMTDGSLGIFKRNGGTGEVYYDTLTIHYTNMEGTRKVNVTVDKLHIPADFCNLFDDPYKVSVISGIEVQIGRMVYDERIYYAEFMFKDVGFRVVSEGVSEVELVSIITSLLD